MATSSSPFSSLPVVNRIAAAILGGYAFTWGFMAVGTALLYAVGMAFHDAESLSAIVGFLVYLILFLWAFAAPRLLRVWLVLVGSGAVMAVTASLIQSQLI